MQDNLKTTFYSTSIEPILLDTNAHCRANGIAANYTFYNGVTFNEREKYENMFSFVPAKIYDENKISSSTFELPTIELDFINHTQVRGINTKVCTEKEISNYWKQIIEQLRNKDLVIANFLKNPKLGKK